MTDRAPGRKASTEASAPSSAIPATARANVTPRAIPPYGSVPAPAPADAAAVELIAEGYRISLRDRTASLTAVETLLEETRARELELVELLARVARQLRRRPGRAVLADELNPVERLAVVVELLRAGGELDLRYAREQLETALVDLEGLSS